MLVLQHKALSLVQLCHWPAGLTTLLFSLLSFSILNLKR